MRVVAARRAVERLLPRHREPIAEMIVAASAVRPGKAQHQRVPRRHGEHVLDAVRGLRHPAPQLGPPMASMPARRNLAIGRMAAGNDRGAQQRPVWSGEMPVSCLPRAVFDGRSEPAESQPDSGQRVRGARVPVAAKARKPDRLSSANSRPPRRRPGRQVKTGLRQSRLELRIAATANTGPRELEASTGSVDLVMAVQQPWAYPIGMSDRAAPTPAPLGKEMQVLPLGGPMACRAPHAALADPMEAIR